MEYAKLRRFAIFLLWRGYVKRLFSKPTQSYILPYGSSIGDLAPCACGASSLTRLPHVHCSWFNSTFWQGERTRG